MGALGYIVGGAMQGIGGAMQQKAVSDAEERRQIALENLRQSNQQANLQLQAKLNDQNAANSDARGDYYDARKTARGATVDEASDKRKFGYQVELKKMEFANYEQKARLESALATGRDAATLNLQAQIQRGEIRQIVESGDGQYYAIRGDGSRVATGVKVPPKALETGGSSSILDAARGRGIGSAATTAAPVKAPAPAKTPAKPAAAKPAPIKPGSKGTVSMSDVDALARARGISRAEAMRFAEGQGFAIAKAPAAKKPAAKPAAKPAPSVDDRWKKALSGQTK